jgi:hypothetical protein
VYERRESRVSHSELAAAASDHLQRHGLSESKSGIYKHMAAASSERRSVASDDVGDLDTGGWVATTSE